MAKSGRNRPAADSGIDTGSPPASAVPIPYTGYPGSDTRAWSPGSTNATARWAMPSFEPISGSTSVSGSRSTPNRVRYQAAIAPRSSGIP